MTSVDNNKRIYTLKEFYTIKENSSPYILPKETMEIIQYVSNLVGSPNYVKTPQFLANGGEYSDKKKKKRTKNNEISSDDWEAIRNFQATVKNEKTGMDKIKDTFRCEINKIADKNYEAQKIIIMEILRENILVWNSDELKTVGELIIEVSSANRFYSKLYCDLIGEIIKTYDFITPLLENFKKEVNESYENLSIDEFSASDDYNELCKKNNKNESRKAKGLFLVNLMLEEFLDVEFITNLIINLQNKLINGIDDSDNNEMNEEISEIVFILLENSYTFLKQEDNTEWEKILKNIENICEMKNNNKGLSNKTIFKQMDILDIVNTT
tara:strand:+ start:27 stop:1004 length:978 start_codon:yes stop_codon:yes gene_type:complete